VSEILLCATDEPFARFGDDVIPEPYAQGFLSRTGTNRRHLVGVGLTHKVKTAGAERRVGENFEPVPVELRRLAADKTELQRDSGRHPDRDAAGSVFGPMFPADEESLLPTKFGANNDLEVCEGAVIDFIFRAIAIDEVSHVFILHEMAHDSGQL
jgi:hypothetical protein